MSYLKNKSRQSSASVPELLCELHENNLSPANLLEISRQKIQEFINQLYKEGVINEPVVKASDYIRPVLYS